MLKQLRKIHAETWIGLASYAVTFAALYRATNNAVREPLGAALFAGFMSIGLAIPVYLVLRFALRTVARLRQRSSNHADATSSTVSVESAENATRERRFRLARHGTVSPTYGKSRSKPAPAGPIRT